MLLYQGTHTRVLNLVFKKKIIGDTENFYRELEVLKPKTEKPSDYIPKDWL